MSMVLIVASRLSKQRPSGLAVESNLCLANDMFLTELCTPANRSCLLTSSSKMLAKCREFFSIRDTDPVPRTIVFMMWLSRLSAEMVRSVILLVA